MDTLKYYRQFKLEPIKERNGGGETVNCFFEDPGFLKRVEISDGHIIVQRICPHGHPSPIRFKADEFSIVGNECPPPEGG